MQTRSKVITAALATAVTTAALPALAGDAGSDPAVDMTAQEAATVAATAKLDDDQVAAFNDWFDSQLELAIFDGRLTRAEADALLVLDTGDRLDALRTLFADAIFANPEDSTSEATFDEQPPADDEGDWADQPTGDEDSSGASEDSVDGSEDSVDDSADDSEDSVDGSADD